MRRLVGIAAIGAVAGALVGLAEIVTGAHGGLVGLALVAGGGLVIGAVQGAALPARVDVRPRPAAPFVLGLVALGLAFADAHILVRRYPAAHVVVELTGFAALEAGLIFAGALRWPRVVTGAAAGAGLLALVAALAVVRGPSGARAAIYADGRLAARVLDLALEAGLKLSPLPVATPPPLGAPPAGPPPRRPGADVVLISVDALRPDHLGPRTSPTIAALAADSTVFERAYTVIPHTSFSITSLLTGVYAHALAQLGPIDGHATLADVLGRAGWRTAAVYPPAVFYVDHGRFRSYEAAHYGFRDAIVEFYPEADDAARRAETVIALLGEPGRAFVWVHFFGPHEPYVAHPGIDFGDRPIDRYDGEIRAVDDGVRLVLAELAARRPQAIVILTADHGEEFGEHGGAYHGTALYDEQVRVPLIVHVPGLAPARVAGPVSTIDVAATIYGLVGVEPPAGLRGTDLSPWLGGGTDQGAPLRFAPHGAEPRGAPVAPVFAELGDQKMVVVGEDKLLCDVVRAACRLFALDEDPGETRDRADERPERAAELLAILRAWMGSQSARGEAIARVALGDRDALEALAAGATALELDDRVAAARALARFVARAAPPSSAAAALAALAADPDARVRAWAACGRARLGLAAAPPLADARFDPELLARVAALRAGAGEAAAVDALAAALPGIAETSLRADAIDALGASRDPRALPALAAAYDYVLTRKQVIRAVAALPGADARAFLTARLAEERYPEMRAAIEAALSRSPDH